MRKPEKPKSSAYDRAIGLLARREHSQRELQRKLQQKGYEAEEAQDAVHRVAEHDYQNDERFAEGFVRHRAGAGYGPMRISGELAQHGLDRKEIAQLLADYDWLEIAQEWAQRRLVKIANSPDDVRRCAAKLQRRGFSTDIAIKVMQSLQSGSE